jgi:hypothetical protein
MRLRVLVDDAPAAVMAELRRTAFTSPEVAVVRVALLRLPVVPLLVLPEVPSREMVFLGSVVRVP